jgi:hypothetical protein
MIFISKIFEKWVKCRTEMEEVVQNIHFFFPHSSFFASVSRTDFPNN